jgi:riboflavin biosynthesis pyrimidine reductase
MRFRGLYPDCTDVEIDAEIRALDLRERSADGRPYTVANFVTSLDGRASVQGRSGALGDDGDKALFHALRGAVDAVLVGTRTLAAERYGRIISDPELRERRRAEGAAPEPLTAVLTRSGRLPLEIPLFAEPEARVVVFAPGALELGDTAAHVEVVQLAQDALDFRHALAHLRTGYDVRACLCEGGPTVLSRLLHERSVDELFLTLAPKLVGGGLAPALTTGAALPELAGAELAGVLEHAGTLFLRYRRRI